MKRKDSNPVRRLSAFLLIPALSVFLLAFTGRECLHVQNSAEGAKTTEEKKKNLYAFFRYDKKYVEKLFVVDGIKRDSMYIENLDLQEIESCSILLKSFAIDFYGEEGKNGAVLVTTKKEANKENKIEEGLTEDKIERRMISEFHKRPGEEYRLGPGSRRDVPKLIVVDGVIVDESALQSIDTSTIKTFSVLRDSSAIAAYGEKGKNGVILITIKETKE
jgi:hypothetical protein